MLPVGEVHGLGTIQVPVTAEEVPNLLSRGFNSNSFDQTLLEVTIGLDMVQRGRKLIRTVLKPLMGIVPRLHWTMVCPKKLTATVQLPLCSAAVEHVAMEHTA